MAEGTFWHEVEDFRRGLARLTEDLEAGHQERLVQAALQKLDVALEELSAALAAQQMPAGSSNLSFEAAPNLVSEQVTVVKEMLDEATGPHGRGLRDPGESNRLGRTARLAAYFAHEVNNPLQTVVGCLGLAWEAMTEGQSGSRYLEVAQEELRRVVETVARFQDVNRRVADAEKVPTDVNEIVEGVVAQVASRCARIGVELVWAPGHDTPPILMVADQMRRVFLNLICNAIEAMPEGGMLEVSTAYLPDQQEVCVTFSGSGVGIPSDALPCLFDPFFTTKRDSVGLGLYVSWSVVGQHGGRIEVESQAREGAAFTVCLPV